MQACTVSASAALEQGPRAYVSADVHERVVALCRFDGDAMVHAVWLEDGAAKSYHNHLLRTPRALAEADAPVDAEPRVCCRPMPAHNTALQICMLSSILLASILYASLMAAYMQGRTAQSCSPLDQACLRRAGG